MPLSGPPPTVPPERLLPTVSIVEQTMVQARRAVALAIVGAALLVGALVAERLFVAGRQAAAEERHHRALALVAALKSADAGMTHAAQMAAATGEQRWIDTYDRVQAHFASALDDAKALAPTSIAAAFELDTAAAQQELTDLREAAFEAVNVGSPEVGRTIFDGERYRRSTEHFAQATAALADAVVASTQQDRADLARRSLLLGAGALAGAVLLGLTMWRTLNRRLRRSRSVFLDAEDRIQRLASSDLLTGLPNRAALHDAMAGALARSQRDGRRLALLMIDLDRFKPVNDRHGHLVGDRVLAEVAKRLGRCLRGGELRARYGGDEFVVAIEEADDPAAARVVADRITQTLAQPIAIDDLVVDIGASVGIARFPDDAHDGDELLRKADPTLYRAKALSRGGVCHDDAQLDARVAERAQLEQALREGIAAGEFVPYYQPIVDLDSCEIRSLELLTPWRHPTRGLLPPAEFIPTAEDSGLIGPMMLSVLRQACLELADVPRHWRLSVNAAPQQILDRQLVPQLLQVLAETGTDPRRLDIELTETALVNDTARAREVMQAMKDAGITVTLDDFGTGHSSLAYLAEMSFDKIKIDRSFVRTLHDRPESAKIVDAVIGLSRSLGVQTVAEGVETERDALALGRLGCGLAQGHLYGRPAPMSAWRTQAMLPPDGDASRVGAFDPVVSLVDRSAKRARAAEPFTRNGSASAATARPPAACTACCGAVPPCRTLPRRALPTAHASRRPPPRAGARAGRSSTDRWPRRSVQSRWRSAARHWPARC